MRKTSLIAGVGLLLLLVGCRQRITDFTVLSTKNFDLSRIDEFTRHPNRVFGEDKVHLILNFPTGNINMKEAIDNAIEKVPGGVAIVDGVVSKYGWWGILYGQLAIQVEGVVLVDPAVRN